MHLIWNSYKSSKWFSVVHAAQKFCQNVLVELGVKWYKMLLESYWWRITQSTAIWSLALRFSTQCVYDDCCCLWSRSYDPVSVLYQKKTRSLVLPLIVPEIVFQFFIYLFCIFSDLALYFINKLKRNNLNLTLNYFVNNLRLALWNFFGAAASLSLVLGCANYDPCNTLIIDPFHLIRLRLWRIISRCKIISPGWREHCPPTTAPSQKRKKDKTSLGVWRRPKKKSLI